MSDLEGFSRPVDHWHTGPSWQVPWLSTREQRWYLSDPLPVAARERPADNPESRTNWLGDSRSRRQFSLFAAGMGFMVLSAAVTRRAFARRKTNMVPRYYRPSNEPPENMVSGPLEALEALQIATMNVASVAATVVFGTLWAFDISSLDDMRRKVRGGLGVDGSGRSEQEVEEHFEEWIAATLQRRQRKEQAAADIPDVGVITTTNDRGRPR